jgi:hypothetical protein
MGSVVSFKRNGLSTTHLTWMAQLLSPVGVMPDCADDGSLFAIIDDDIGLPIEVCLTDGLFIAARGGLCFAKTRRFDDIMIALNEEVEDCR